MERDVRIKLSAGLVVVAMCHAVVLALLFAALHLPTHQDAPLIAPMQSVPPGAAPMGDYRAATNAPVSLPPVNHTARDEIKQQADCPTCPQPTFVPQVGISSADQSAAQAVANQYSANLVTVRDLQRRTISAYASLSDGRTWVSTGKNTTYLHSGSNCYRALLAEMQRGVNSPAATPLVTPSVPRPNVTPAPQTTGNNKYQIALFVSNDAQSQQLIAWFDSDPQLRNLRLNTNFQIYTADNPLYQSRYAAHVPIDEFPAILFLKPDGGHIHAAGKSMLPRTSSDLVSDIRQSLELAKSAAPQPTGLIRETGYSWDNAINPQMQLQSGDCPDGWCPPDAARPGLVPRLLDRVDDREAMMWFGLEEIVVILLAVVAIILIIIIVVKRS